MDLIKKVSVALLGLAALAPIPAMAEDVGYIRIGNECFVNVGYPTPVWIPITCPRVVTGD